MPHMAVLGLLLVARVWWWFAINPLSWFEEWAKLRGVSVAWRSVFDGPWRWYPHLPSGEASPEEWQQAGRERVQALVAIAIAFGGVLLRMAVLFAQVHFGSAVLL